MLQIRLSSKGGGGAGGGSGEGGGSSVAKSTAQIDSVTVACPDHLILADLPVAKSLGGVFTAASVRSVGRRLRKYLERRVHFCVSCDFPIAVYGRLMPCEHAFCLACARTDPSCYICEERIQKIQAIKLTEEIHICAAPRCFKSFLCRSEFKIHVHENHADLLNSNIDKEVLDDNNANTVKPSSTDAQKQSLQPEISTARAPPSRSVFSPSYSQNQDREDRTNRLQSRDSQPPRPNNNWFPPPPAGPPPPYQQNTDQFSSDKLTNNPPEIAFSNFQTLPPLLPMNYSIPLNVNQVMVPSQFPYDNSGSEQQGLAMGIGGFPDNLARPWGMVGPMGVQFHPIQMSHGGNMPEGFGNLMDNQVGVAYFQGMAMNPGLVQDSEQQSGLGSDQIPQIPALQPPLPRQPPPPMPPPLSQQQQSRDFPPGFGWNDKRGTD